MIHNLTKMAEKFGIEGKLFAWQGEYCKKKYVAEALFQQALQSGELTPGQPIVEWSSGNMAKYVAEEAAKIGSPLTVIGGATLREKLPDWVELIEPGFLNAGRAVGVESSKKVFDRLAKNYAAKTNAFYFNQLGNPAHIQFYETVAIEAIESLPLIDMYTDHIGSGATLIGMGSVLKKTNLNIEIIVNPSSRKNWKESIIFEIPFETKGCAEVVSEISTADVSFCLEHDFNIKRYSHSRGNVLAALNWLKQNPGKTAFTTIGD